MDCANCVNFLCATGTACPGFIRKPKPAPESVEARMTRAGADVVCNHGKHTIGNTLIGASVYADKVFLSMGLTPDDAEAALLAATGKTPADCELGCPVLFKLGEAKDFRLAAKDTEIERLRGENKQLNKDLDALGTALVVAGKELTEGGNEYLARNKEG